MMQAYFDRTGRVQQPKYRQLCRELIALLLDHPTPPDARQIPPGDGHIVLVLPAFLTGDWATAPFRRFLRQCGLRAEGWRLGTNWGPTPGVLAGLRRRITELREQQGGPISLVGISLGGLLARDLAHSQPQDVRQVITMASPWRLPTASTIEPLVRITTRFHSRDIDLARLSRPLAMPETSLYTRDDGIVAWQTCCPEPGQGGTAIEVRGAHVTICRNPQAMIAVARCLTDPRPSADAGPSRTAARSTCS